MTEGVDRPEGDMESPTERDGLRVHAYLPFNLTTLFIIDR